jgi:hypothetical protein
MTLPRFYHAYGLCIESDFELPELEPSASRIADIRIRRSAIESHDLDSYRNIFEFTQKTAYMSWPMAGRFLIGEGVIDVEPLGIGDEAKLRMPLLGPVFAMMLHFRGLYVLHASAVSIGGAGAIFLGKKRAGKSTTAAALVAAGHQLISDDVVALDFSGGQPVIVPAFPQVKLEPSAAARFFGEGFPMMPEIVEGLEKSQYRLGNAFSPGNVMAGVCYSLSRDDRAVSEPLATEEALPEVLKSTYIARFVSFKLDPSAAAVHLERSAKLTRMCRRLRTPDSLDRIGEVAATVEEDLAHMIAPKVMDPPRMLHGMTSDAV